jgi:mono/diheme cytochrome c family protein
MSRMLRQPRISPQAPSAFFADGRAMRPPAPGTVARGHLPLGVASEEEAALLVNPLPVTAPVLARGRRAFQDRCALCHGPLGTGQGSLGAAYGATPANLQSRALREAPDGKLYWTLVNGKDAMPGQGKDLDVDTRWAVVHYVRALQRAQNARDEDLP